MKSITELLEGYTDNCLVAVAEELLEDRAPTDGIAYMLLRNVNRAIDNGQLKYNSNARHMYMPTLRTLVERELARRYVIAINIGMLQAEQVTRTIKAAKDSDQVPGQISLEVVS